MQCRIALTYLIGGFPGIQNWRIYSALTCGHAHTDGEMYKGLEKSFLARFLKAKMPRCVWLRKEVDASMGSLPTFTGSQIGTYNRRLFDNPATGLQIC